MLKMPTGPFEMAPLGQFVVTERKPKGRELIHIADWFNMQDPKPNYHLDLDSWVITIEHKEPVEYECFTSNTKWQIKWLG